VLLRAIIADSHLYLRVWPNATQITVNYSATSDAEVDTTDNCLASGTQPQQAGGGDGSVGSNIGSVSFLI